MESASEEDSDLSFEADHSLRPFGVEQPQNENP